MNKKIVVTGGSGFVGNYLINELNREYNKVINIDINTGYDITNFKSVKDISKFDILVHLAAKTFVPDSYKYPIEFYKINLLGTLNALELCRKYKAKMIFISSYVYGVPQYLPIDEKHPLQALNPYAESKIMGEDLCRAYYRDFKVPVIILRPSNIYGTGQSDEFLIPKIIKQAKRGKIILENSKPKRDLIFINDFIKLIKKLIDLDFIKYDIFNVGSGTSISVENIANTITELLNYKGKVIFTGKTRIQEVMDTIYCIDKIKKHVNWQPYIEFKQGLSSML